MDINEVFAGIAARADTIAGLRGLQYMPDAVTPPMFAPMDVEGEFDKTFGRGMDELSVRCLLLISRATDKQGQAKLNAYLSGSGAKSIKAALFADRTLGGSCDDSHVVRFTGYGQFEHAGITYYGAEFFVRVIGEGD